MDTDIQYAIINAAYAAWETGVAQKVEGFSIIVIPETQQAEIDTYLQTQGLRLEGAVLPKFWIEHEGRRAQIAWYVSPPLTPREE